MVYRDRGISCWLPLDLKSRKTASAMPQMSEFYLREARAGISRSSLSKASVLT
jgi:hypothetical protein